MTATPRPETALFTLCSTPLRRAGRTWAARCLAAGLLLSGGAFAEEPAGLQEPLAEVALHQPEAAASTGIRMRLHGVEDLNAAPAPELSALTPGEEPASAEPRTSLPDTGADELKKRAQTKYLAAKLKKQETAVRKYVDLAWAEAYRRDWLEPELLIAIIHKESAFRPKVQSRYGAQGLMQVVRRWHGDKLRPSESLFDPAVNIRVGADVLEEYLALADGNLDHALRKYSGNARNYANAIKKETLALARVAERAASRAMLAQG